MTEETIWLTYEDAAKKLGISIDSVRRKARKELWIKRKNNYGKITIAVPFNSSQKTRQQTDLETGHNVYELQKKLAVLEIEIKLEKNRADTFEADRDAWKKMAETVVAENKEMMKTINNMHRPWWKKLFF